MNIAMNNVNVNRTQRPFMEHRWGQRVPLDLPVRLELAGELLAHGRIQDASISGAYVTTDTRFPALAAIEVVLRTPSGRTALPACVVRRADGGVGLEWRDMACPSLVALLRDAGGTELWCKDRTFGRA